MVLDFGLGLGGGDDLFPSSSAEGDGLNAPVVTQIVWKDVGVGIVPIGGIVAWCKDLDAGIPPLIPNYVECNGQVLDDGDSPINGATIPNLNANRFLRGQATSGGVGGSENHNHTISSTSRQIGASATGGTSIGNESTLPSYYQVVWVMRIK